MLEVNQVRRLSPLEGKRLAQARERGYLTAHVVNSEKHKRVSNAWWQICEDEGRYFVRVNVSRNGRAASLMNLPGKRLDRSSVLAWWWCGGRPAYGARAE